MHLPETVNTPTYRAATPLDAGECIQIRGKTRENAFSEAQLAALGITAKTWSTGIADGNLPGHICTINGKMVGYCFGDKESGEIVVLALLPEYEGAGIGQQLLALMISDFKTWGFDRLFLGCASDPNVRSYGFYRHLGWKSTGKTDELGDEVLELLLS